MRCRTSGFTLPEVVMAMAIAAMIGLSIVGVSAALSGAYAQSQDFYQCLQTGRSTMARIQAAVRKAKLVTYVSPTRLLLWQDDLNGDGQINLLEISAIAFDAPSRQVRLYTHEFPQSLGDLAVAALNQKISLSTAMSASTVASAMSGPYIKFVILADDVKNFKVSAVTAPPLTQVVQMTLKAAKGKRSIKFRSAVSLRAGKVDYVGASGTSYYLSTEKVTTTVQ